MLRQHSSGERDRLITVQQATDGRAPSGAPIETWTQLCTVMASYRPVGGRERVVMNQISAPFDTQWQIAYRPDMDPDVVNVPKSRRLVFAGRVHDIVSAAVVGRRSGVELMTLSGGAAGG
jgi:SPP1 family predicted phage head-tail adaptor